MSNYDDFAAEHDLNNGIPEPSSNQDFSDAATEFQSGLINPAHADYQTVTDTRNPASGQHADNPQAADGAMHQDAMLAETAGTVESTTPPSAAAPPTSYTDDTTAPFGQTAGDLPEAGGKLDASPSHSFDATSHPDLAADAGAAQFGQTPAPAATAVGGNLSTQPAKTTAGVQDDTAFAGRPAPEGAIRGGAPSPVVMASDIPVTTTADPDADKEIHDAQVNDALELDDAVGEEIHSLRRALVTLRSNSAANQPGTFVGMAIADIEAVIGRLELSAEKSNVDVSTAAVEQKRADRAKQQQDDSDSNS